MNPELQKLLEKIFADRILSRREKQTLRPLLSQLEPREKAEYLGQAFEWVLEKWPSGQTKEEAEFLKDLALFFLTTSEKKEEVEQQACFSPGDQCAHMIRGFIENAKRKMDLCVFTITDNELSRAILDAYHRGIQIRIITDDQKMEDKGSDIEQFRQAGIPVKTDDSESHMHHKFAIFDSHYLLLGSYNWTRGARHQQEDILTTNDPKLVKAYQKQFEKLWRKF